MTAASTAMPTAAETKFYTADPRFGRILATYGGIFVAGSLVCGVVVDGFRPDRFDQVGAANCLLGVAVIMYGPRAR